MSSSEDEEVDSDVPDDDEVLNNLAGKHFRHQTKEEQIYGVFAEAPAFKSKRDKNKVESTRARAAAPLAYSFVSGGIMKKSELDIEIEKQENDNNNNKRKMENEKKNEPPLKKTKLDNSDFDDPFGLGGLSFGKKRGVDKWKETVKARKKMGEQGNFKPGVAARPKWNTSVDIMRMMGSSYKGGALGKNNENGLIEPVQVQFRKGKAGIAVTKKKKIRKEVEEQKENEKQLREERKKERQKRWMLGQHNQKKKKVKIKTADDIGTKEQPLKITDMTGAKPRVISVDELKSKAPIEERPKFCREFLLNTRTIVDVTEGEIRTCNREVKVIDDLLDGCDRELEEATRFSTQGGNVQTRLREIMAIIDTMVPDLTNENYNMNPRHRYSSHLTPFQLCEEFRRLQQYQREYVQYGLANLAICLVFPMLQHKFAHWEPFKAPQMASVVLRDWRPILSGKGGSGNARDIYTQLVEKTVFPNLHHALTNIWNPHDPHGAMELLDGSRDVIPHHSIEVLIDNCIIPKLLHQVENWDPRGGNTTMDVWILPWQRYISRVNLHPLCARVRRRISRCLQNWRVSDPCALFWLSPFLKADVWDKDDLELIFKDIFPKLERALRECHEPNKSGVDYFVCVREWEPLLSVEQYEFLLQKAFFPKWFSDLHTWLSDPKINCQEVHQWYVGWKNAFSENMIQSKVVQDHFMAALDMINWTLSGKGKFPDLQLISITLNLDLGIKKKKAAATKKSSFKEEKEIEYQFSEILEKYATQNGFGLLLKQVSTRTLKTIYSFGGVSCYIEKDVVFAKIKKESDYEPINFRELLHFAQQKAKR